MVHYTNAMVAAASIFLGASTVLAHPGHDVHAEYAQRHAALHAMPMEKKSLARCAAQLKARGFEDKIKAERASIVEDLRQKRAIKKRSMQTLKARDAESVLATDHQSNLTGITIDTDPSTLFAANKSCVLTPEVTEGPYYVEGELVRQDITEGQDGIPMTISILMLDTNTCEPVPDTYVDYWHCNATGVYSGVVANGNGNADDETNLDNTALRGIQKSDSNGILRFDAVFPGHYTGRATHVHILSHNGATEQSNKTISGGGASHVGQIFFDQSLITEADTVEPYASNTQTITLNSDDSIFAEEAADVDPVAEYVLLGDSISDGIFAWISFGIDSSMNKTVSAAAHIYADGGVANENSGMGGGPGGAPPGSNGTASGTPPADASGVPSATTPAVVVQTSESVAASAVEGSTLLTKASVSAIPSPPAQQQPGQGQDPQQPPQGQAPGQGQQGPRGGRGGRN